MRDNPLSLRKRLRSLRKAQSLTLQNLADAAGCTKAYIWELECLPNPRPSAQRMIAIARALGTTVEVLMGAAEPALPAADQRFIRDYLALPEVERSRLRRIARVLSEE